MYPDILSDKVFNFWNKTSTENVPYKILVIAGAGSITRIGLCNTCGAECTTIIAVAASYNAFDWFYDAIETINRTNPWLI